MPGSQQAAGLGLGREGVGLPVSLSTSPPFSSRVSAPGGHQVCHTPHFTASVLEVLAVQFSIPRGREPPIPGGTGRRGCPSARIITVCTENRLHGNRQEISGPNWVVWSNFVRAAFLLWKVGVGHPVFSRSCWRLPRGKMREGGGRGLRPNQTSWDYRGREKPHLWGLLGGALQPGNGKWEVERGEAVLLVPRRLMELERRKSHGPWGSTLMCCCCVLGRSQGELSFRFGPSQDWPGDGSGGVLLKDRARGSWRWWARSCRLGHFFVFSPELALAR